jgi:thiamine pyrophosphokinase
VAGVAAQRRGAVATDPWNLNWVIPAEGTVAEPTSAVIFAGGEPEPSSVRRAIPDDRFVIAADSGLHTALCLDTAVDLIVGDLDSADPAEVARAMEGGARLEQHPAAKDATDLELALEAARARGLEPAIVIGGGSLDRIDHFMANALLLASPRFAPMRPQWLVQGTRVLAVHDRASFHGAPGDVITLLAVGGPAVGVRTEGLLWELDGDRLEPGSTRGVSNEMTDTGAAVVVDDGVLLAIHVRRPQ